MAESKIKKRPAMWAEPMPLPGIPNLHRVSDHLYRSAQPTALGMKCLKAMGIRAIVNLRSYHSARREIGRTRLRCEHIPMKASHSEAEDIVSFLKFVTVPRNCPVLVHCQYGSNRTGVMCAAYRMVVEGWPREAALREMTDGDFGFRGIWDNHRNHLNELDVDQLRGEIDNGKKQKRTWQ